MLVFADCSGDHANPAKKRQNEENRGVNHSLSPEFSTERSGSVLVP